jgi:hypothetical protein
MDEFEEKLQSLLWDANTQKAVASENQGGVLAKRWAVLATDLEKSLAYYIVNLKSKPSKENES